MSEVSEKTTGEIDSAKEVEFMKKIEAALFISGRWLRLQELVVFTDITPVLLRQLIEKLIDKYSDDGTAIEILNKDDMWKMDVGKEHVDIVNRLATGSAEFTKAEQETLAIIAYKQPVKQSIIVKIRGNKAYEHIKKFKELGLVRAKRLGRTFELNLSDEFYDYFHLGKKEVIPNKENKEIEKKEEKEEEKKEPKQEEKKEEAEEEQKEENE